MAQTELEIRVTAELREIRAALTSLTTQVDQFNQRTARAAQTTRPLVTNLQQSAIASRQAAAGADSLRNSISGAVAQVRLLVGGLGVAGIVTSFVRMADTATLLRGQLDLATKSQEELTRAQRETFRIAQQTRQGLEGTVNLYARIARAGRTTQTQTLALTESINQAVALSFTTAQAGEAALFQLGQGLASGTLRGEELNSVLEQTPRLAEAISQGLVALGEIDTTSQLRKFASEGKLTADLVTRAIETQQQVLRDEFAKLPATVGQSFTMLRNAALQFVGDVDSANGSTRQLAEAIQFLAENLQTIAGILITGAKLWAGYYAAFRLLPAVITGLAASFVFLRNSMALATPAMRAFQLQLLQVTSSVTGATLAVQGFSLSMNLAALGAASAATRIRAAAAVAFAAWAGWELGSYLRDEFLQVELAGIALAAGLHRIANAIKNAFIAGFDIIKAGALQTFNAVLDLVDGYYSRLAEIQRRVPVIGDRLAAISTKWAASARNARVETESMSQAYDRMAATAESELAAIDLAYAEIADAAIASRGAQEEAGAAGAEAAAETEAAVKGAADAWKLLRDAAERALRDLEQRYEDFGISTREYFAERIRLQQAAIDADLAAARAQAAGATTENERRNALTQIIILERERRDIAVQGARDQAKAEEELARQLGEVYIRTLELSGETARARTLQMREQYQDLLARLRADSNQAGIDMVERLINLEGARAGLQQFQTEFRDVTGSLTQLQQTTAAQVAAGQLSNATAEQRLEQARTTALQQLRDQRTAVAELYAQYRDPETLQHLQTLDQQIAQLSITTDDWRGKIQDAGQDALTTFFRDLATGAVSAADAVRNLAVNFTQAMAQMAAQALAKRAIQGIMDMFVSGGDQDPGAQVAAAAAAGLAYATPVQSAAGTLAVAGGVVQAAAVQMGVSAQALQAAATALAIANGIGGAAGGVAHTGGIAGALAAVRNVNPALFLGAPRYHTGGVAGLRPNEVPAILQKGEEVLTRQDPRHRFNGGRNSETSRPEERRFIFIDDQRQLGNWLNSPTGTVEMIEWMGQNAGAVRELVR